MMSLIAIEDMIEAVATDTPITNLEEIKLEDFDLNVDQLPLILLENGINEIFWERNAIIIGPDGSRIRSLGQGDLIKVRTPVSPSSIPWKIPKLDKTALTELVEYLLPVREGQSYLNPAPWDTDFARLDRSLYAFRAGEISTNLRESEEKLEADEISITTPFYNPEIRFQNPLFIQTNRIYNGRTSWLEIKLDNEGIFAASESLMEYEFVRGTLHLSGKDLVVKKYDKYPQDSPLRTAWSLSNEIIELDFEPKASYQLFSLIPSSVIPIHLSFVGGNVKLKLLNLSGSPVIAELRIAARILKASVNNEEIIPEFDTIKVPIRRWGIAKVEMKVVRIVESLLKKFRL
ncbi:hypothetical protein HS7_20190 [Sulfolobales archaeon HS-7]|nr:hypothetical protein HS7_20190 [Sulfolobales archaeon HS-7]